MEATDKLDVTLEARQWDAVLAVMSKAPIPYEVVAPLIGEIQRQCQSQSQPAPRLVEQPAAE